MHNTVHLTVNGITFQLSQVDYFRSGAFWTEKGLLFSVSFPGAKTRGVILRSGPDQYKIPFDGIDEKGTFYCIRISGQLPEELSYIFYADDYLFSDPFGIHTKEKRPFGDRTPYYCEPTWINDDLMPIPDGNSKNRLKAARKSFAESFFYLIHVRGFTMDPTAKVTEKGTFRGLKRKINYLQKLGVTTAVLMPVYDFCENSTLQNLADPTYERIPAYFIPDSNGKKKAKQEKLNFWGYTSASNYYLPKPAYTYSDDSVTEFLELVDCFHKSGIEVILQFYFDEMITVSEVIPILRYWHFFYGVDGFQILGDSDRITSEIMLDHSLSECRILSENGSVFDHKTSKSQIRAGIIDREYLYRIRSFLKADPGSLETIRGYLRRVPNSVGNLQTLALWDTMRLVDFVSYNEKHNEGNGEENRDGADYNASWNCGVEGPSKKTQIKRLRERQIRNALMLLFFTEGTPFLVGGDEFLNSAEGNNNPYCQDNPVGWVNWGSGKSAKQLTSFVTKLCELRAKYSEFGRTESFSGMDRFSCGYPDISFHGDEAFKCSTDPGCHSFGTLYTGLVATADGSKKHFLYLAINMHWNSQKLAVPILKDPNAKWSLVIGSGDNPEGDEELLQESIPQINGFIQIPARTIWLIEAPRD